MDAHSHTMINFPWLTPGGMETWKGKVRLVEWNPPNIFIWKGKAQPSLVAMQHNHVIPFPFLCYSVQPCPCTTAILQHMQDKFMTSGHKKLAKPYNYRIFLAIKLTGSRLQAAYKQPEVFVQGQWSICTAGGSSSCEWAGCTISIKNIPVEVIKSKLN